MADNTVGVRLGMSPLPAPTCNSSPRSQRSFRSVVAWSGDSTWGDRAGNIDQSRRLLGDCLGRSQMEEMEEMEEMALEGDAFCGGADAGGDDVAPPTSPI